MSHNEKVWGPNNKQNDFDRSLTSTVGSFKLGDNFACIHENNNGLRNISDIMTESIILHILRNYGARVKRPPCIGERSRRWVRTPCDFSSAFWGYRVHIEGGTCSTSLQFVTNGDRFNSDNYGLANY